MTIKGVLFDKDGTLTDFHATWIPAYYAAAEQLSDGLKQVGLADLLMSADGYDKLVGRCEPSSALACGSTSEIALLWASVAGTDDRSVLQMLEQTFSVHAADNAVPATDLTALFSSLTGRGLILGLATMDSEALAHKLLRNFDLARFFSFVCGYDSGYGEKPTPGMVRAFCDVSGLAPEEIAVVGDTPHDLNMARNAGAALRIGVLSGASDKRSLKHLADHVLSHIGELESVLS